MAQDFPVAPANGEQYTDPLGQTWKYQNRVWSLASPLGYTFEPIQATGTGSAQNITLPIGGFDEGDVLVTVDGLVRLVGTYSISGTTLTLTAGAATTIVVRPMTQVKTQVMDIEDVLNALPVMQAPQVSFLASGSGTYNTPVGTLYLRVKGKGGGSGGNGSGGFAVDTPSSPAPGNGTAGGNTTFGSELTAFGGSATAGIVPGSGGVATGGDINRKGADGGPARDYYKNQAGGDGGGGKGGRSRPDGPGQDAAAGSGCGGAGAGASSNRDPGAGGAEGGEFEKVIANPATSYAWVVGEGGAGGAAGVNGFAGGNGARHGIEVWAYFQ